MRDLFKSRKTRKRIGVSLKSEIILKGKGHKGYIADLSEKGMKWYQHGDAVPLSPGEQLKMKFRLPSGQYLDLYCKVKWTNKKSAAGGASPLIGVDAVPEYTEAGLEIINPTPQYKDFFKSLHE